MKLFFLVLATLAVVEGRGAMMAGGGGGTGGGATTVGGAPPTPSNIDLSICETAGGPGGQPFADDKIVSDGQTLTEIKLCSGERLDGIGYTIVSQANKKDVVFHGSDKNCQVITLAANEHITSYEAHIANRFRPSKMRIGHIKLVTEEKKVYEAGVPNKYIQANNVVACKAPPGQRLGGFSGRAGKEVDALKPIWTPLPVGPHHEKRRLD